MKTKLAAKIVAHFSAKKWRLAAVESITGGRISAKITAVPGASKIFFAGGVFYDSAAKRQFLKINFQKVFSRETAEKMAKSFREITAADFAVATTGRAENGKKTFFAVATATKVFSTEKIFFGNREKIQNAAANFALEFLEKIISTTILKSPF